MELHLLPSRIQNTETNSLLLQPSHFGSGSPPRLPASPGPLMSVSVAWEVGGGYQSICILPTPCRRGPVSFLCDAGIFPCCSQHHPSCSHTCVISRSFIIARVLERLLPLSQRHLCRPENGCALSFPPPHLSRADLCPRRSFPRFYFWSFKHRGPVLFPSPALPDTSPVISESPGLPVRPFLSRPSVSLLLMLLQSMPHTALAFKPSAWLLKALSSAVPSLQLAWKLFIARAQRVNMLDFETWGRSPALSFTGCVCVCG